MAFLEFTPYDTWLSSVMSDTLSKFNETSWGKYHLVEEDNGSFLYVSAPGYKPEDLTVEMHEGRLTVQGKPSIEHKSVGVIVPNQINIRFSVSPNYLVDSAEFTNGVLAVKLTKSRKTEALKIPVMSK